MHYVIYLITNTRNGMRYVGMHQTNDLDDGYMGSGVGIREAIAVEGIHNFRKDILHVFTNREDMIAKEKEIVNETFVKRKDTYNRCIGGQDGFYHINRMKLNIYTTNGGNGRTPNVADNFARGQDTMTRLRGNEEWMANYRNKISRGVIAYQSLHGNPFSGMKHTNAAKDCIGKKSSIHQAGINNSQYGTRWITNGIDNKKIDKRFPLPDRWRYGKIPSRAETGNHKTKNPSSSLKKLITLGNNLTTLHTPLVLCSRCDRDNTNKIEAEWWYDKLLGGDATSIRQFVYDSDYPKSHVSFIKMLKTYIPEFVTTHGSAYKHSSLD